jgi:hypothetical protein
VVEKKKKRRRKEEEKKKVCNSEHRKRNRFAGTETGTNIEK